jgi:hypothetical protein
VVHPDYSNPKRIQATQLQERVLNLDKFNTSIYKCPVKSFYYKDNNEEEASVIVFKSDDITNQIWPNRVLVSSQAGGIVHKINFTMKYDAFTFSYATLASLTDIVKYADFRDHPIEFSNSSDNEWTEDLPSDNLYSFLENYTSPLNHIYNMNNVSVFKCLGRPQTLNNTNVYSTYILIESTDLTQTLSENDFIYGNQTFGFLERTIATDQLQVGSGEEKLLIQTELVRGDELNNNSVFNFDVNLKNKSELICTGRSNSNSSMFIVDLSTFAYNLSQNVIIPGRASKRFAMKIIEKRILLNGYILFECIPITYINISNTNAKYLIEQTFSKSYYETYKLPTPGGDLSLTVSIIPSLTVSFDFDFNRIDYFTINYVGAEVGLEMNVGLSGELGLTDETFTSPKIPIVKDKTLKRFVIYLGPIPIPGRLSLDIVNEVSVELKDASSIQTSLDANVNLRTTISSRWAKSSGLTSNAGASGPSLNIFNFVPYDYKELVNTASLTIKNTLTPTLKVTLLSLLSDNEVDSIAEKLPNLDIPKWLKNNRFYNINETIKDEIKDFFSLILNLDVPVYVQGVLKLCSVNCVTDQDKPLGASISAGIENPKVSLSFTKYNYDVNVPLSRNVPLREVCLPKPSIIPCGDTDANGKCLCKCPDGTQPQLVNNVYKCSCKCLDGRESNQLDDGSCNCTCKCPDNSKATIEKGGCPCPCKCENCKQSVKYIDINGQPVTTLPGTNGEGCLCPSDEIDPDCAWVNCEIKCPPKPPGGGGGGGSSGDGDVHFRTFDGRSYDFQGFGEYTYCKGEFSDLDIQIRTFWPYRGSGVSLIGGVAVKLGLESKLTVFIQKNSTIVIRLNGKIINDSLLPFQAKIDDSNEGITVNINRYGISIEKKYFWSIGIGLRIYRLSLNVILQQNPFSFFSYPSAYRGLCGNFDSNRFNDLIGPDETLYSNENDFGYSWKINGSSNASQSTWLYGVSNFHPDDILDERFHDVPDKASRNKLISIESATEICLKNSLSGTLLDNCVLDITETGDLSFARDNVYNTDSCPNQCSFNGNCMGVNQCQCFDGWSGSLCDIASCKFQCGKHGSCQNGVCKCDIGWEGDSCTTSVSCEQVNNCTDLNHGVCVGMNKCQCFSGYEGVNCSKKISCELLSNCSGKMRFFINEKNW